MSVYDIVVKQTERKHLRFLVDAEDEATARDEVAQGFIIGESMPLFESNTEVLSCDKQTTTTVFGVELRYRGQKSAAWDVKFYTAEGPKTTRLSTPHLCQLQSAVALLDGLVPELRLRDKDFINEGADTHAAWFGAGRSVSDITCLDLV